MQQKSTEQLVHEHSDLIRQLDVNRNLEEEISYIRLPYQQFSQDVFFERRESGKRRLMNSVGKVMPSDRVKVERTMSIKCQSNGGKKTIKVDTRSTYPNVIFFTDCGDQIDHTKQQLIADLAFRLWHKSQASAVTDRDIDALMKLLSAVQFHHTDQQQQADVCKFLMFTDMENGRYLAPLAHLQSNPSKQSLMDMKYVIENEELPEHIQQLRLEDMVGLRRSSKPYASKALQDIKRVLSNTSKQEKEGINVAADLIQQHFRTNPHLAVDLYDIVMNDKDNRELITDMANSTLMQTAAGDQSVNMTTEDKARIIKKEFIEGLINRY